MNINIPYYSTLLNQQARRVIDVAILLSELFKGLAQNVKIPDAPKIRDTKEKKAKELLAKEKDEMSDEDREILAALGGQGASVGDVDDSELIAQISY